MSISRTLDIKTIAVGEFPRAALDAIPVGIVLVGGDLSIVYANAAAQLLEGCDAIARHEGKLKVPFPARFRQSGADGVGRGGRFSMPCRCGTTGQR